MHQIDKFHVFGVLSRPGQQLTFKESKKQVLKVLQKSQARSRHLRKIFKLKIFKYKNVDQIWVVQKNIAFHQLMQKEKKITYPI